MLYVEAPNRNVDPKAYKIFLAGGITNCSDWQSVLIKRLQDLPDDVLIFNPRRAAWPSGERASEVEAQIKWEFDALHSANLVVFWFPCQSLCPITLYELGYQNGKEYSKKIIGIHPMFDRRIDIEMQTKLADKLHDRDTPIVYSLAEVADKVRAWWNFYKGLPT